MCGAEECSRSRHGIACERVFPIFCESLGDIGGFVSQSLVSFPSFFSFLRQAVMVVVRVAHTQGSALLFYRLRVKLLVCEFGEFENAVGTPATRKGGPL